MIIRILCLAVLATAVSGCMTGLGPLRTEIARYDYTLYEPPRTDHGPGWVFVLAKTFDNRTASLSVCNSLFPTVNKRQGSLSLANIATKTEVGVDIAVDLLKGLINSPVQAKAALSDVDSVEIEWGAVTSEEIPVEDMFTADGTRRPIHPACFAAMQQYKQSNGPESLFVVQAAAIAKEMKYTFKAKQGVDLGVGLNLINKLTVNAGVNIKQEGTTTLVITEPRYIGFIAFAAKDVVPVAGFAGQQADIKGRRFTAQEMRRLED